MNQKNSSYREIGDRELSIEIARMAEEYFAEEVKIIDVKKMSGVVDYLILMTGNSSTQVISLCNKLDKPIRLARQRLGMEGRTVTPDWILLDYGTINVHVFDSTARLYYNLDELWNGDLVIWEEIKKVKKRG
jgi:ribosome-associated protein